MESHCYDQHCGLCTFELHGDELIVGGSIEGEEIETLGKRRIELCDWGCSHKNDLAAAFHASCYTYAGTDIPVKQLGRIARHSLIPEAETSLANPTVLKKWIARGIHENYPLPMDICYQIAVYLIVPCSIAATLSAVGGQAYSTTISPSQDIWAHFVKIHGTAYVASLSHSPVAGPGKTAVLICRPTIGPRCELHVAYDPWGVKRVVFTSIGTKLNFDKSSNTWWESMYSEMVSSSPKVVTTSDGTKLRTVSLGAPQSMRLVQPFPTMSKRGWETYVGRIATAVMQLTPITLNRSNTVAYYAELKRRQILRLTAVDSKGRRRACFQARGEADAWLYMPVNPGEWVKTAWLRTMNKTPGVFALVFILNTGRALVIGPHPYTKAGIVAQTSYKLLCAVETSQPMELDISMVHGLQLAGRLLHLNEDDYNESELVRPCLPRPRSAHPVVSPYQILYFSSATLCPNVHMRLCVDGHRVIGMALAYPDGTAAALGRVRLEALQPAREILQEGIWILTEMVEEYPVVTRVMTTAPKHEADKYLHVRWQGPLEWWASQKQCELHYDGKQTLTAHEEISQ